MGWTSSHSNSNLEGGTNPGGRSLDEAGLQKMRDLVQAALRGLTDDPALITDKMRADERARLEGLLEKITESKSLFQTQSNRGRPIIGNEVQAAGRLNRAIQEVAEGLADSLGLAVQNAEDDPPAPPSIISRVMNQ